MIMERQMISLSSWENDDEFLSTYLIPNKAKFIDYSTTALNEFIKEKNKVYLLSLDRALSEESALFKEKQVEIRIRKLQSQKHEALPEISIPANEVQISENFTNYLKKYRTVHAVFETAYQQLKIGCGKNVDGEYYGFSNATDVCGYLNEQASRLLSDTSFQHTLSGFLSEVIPAYRVLMVLLPSVVGGGDNRQRAYSASVLKDTVLNKFPHRQFFTQYEENPAKYTHDISFRKTIILLYYVSYAYNWVIALNDPTFAWGNVNYDLDSFMEGLNELLLSCQCLPLYPANQYDWLILRSIKEFEVAETEDSDNPLEFFNDVLEYSFPEEDYD